MTYSLTNQTCAGVLLSNNSCEIQLNRLSYKHSRSRGWSRKDVETSSFKGKRSRYENIERQISNIQGILFPPAPSLQTVSATMLAILVSVDYMTWILMTDKLKMADSHHENVEDINIAETNGSGLNDVEETEEVARYSIFFFICVRL